MDDLNSHEHFKPT